MPKITVITPSIRPGYLGLTQECLERQTFQDFEWIVGIGLRNRGYTLPSDLNTLISRAKGEIIVIYQDCIKIPDNALEVIASLDHEKKAYTYPVGQVMTLDDIPRYDWRIVKEGEMLPRMWETDFASAPRSLFYDVGGYDEEFNKGWSWENVEIAVRAEVCGYKFYCYKALPVIHIEHDKLEENPFRNKRENNDRRARDTQTLAEGGYYRKNHLLDVPKMKMADLLDQLSILYLKLNRLKDPSVEAEIMRLSLSLPEEAPYWLHDLTAINGHIWDLEADIRRGKEGELGLEEVGRRALAIRDINNERIAYKNKISETLKENLEIKVDHASM